MNVSRQLAWPALFVLTLGTGACLDSLVKPIGPENAEIVSNVPDDFHYQSDELDNVIDARVFTWRNNGTIATVKHQNFIHHGSVMLEVRDAVGALVDSLPMEWNLETETKEGVPGNWHLTFKYYNARGRVDVELVRKPEP